MSQQKQDTFVVAIAVLTMQLGHSDSDVGPSLTTTKGSVAHTTAEALHVVVQAQGLYYHCSTMS